MQTDIFKVGKREPLPYSGLQKCSTNLHKALRKRQREREQEIETCNRFKKI